MTKLISKKTFFTLFICFTAFIAKAQIGYDFSHYDIGVAAGFNTVFGDELPQKTTPSVNFTITYNQTPFTNFVFEAQLGRMAGGDSLKSVLGRQFTSTFNAFVFRGQLQFGEFIDYLNSPVYNAIKNFYVSAGIGYMVTHITSISRYSPQTGAYTGGENNSQEPFLPLRIGYEFKLYNKYQQPSFKIDLGYGFNYIFGDNLDGYAVGKSNDSYSQFSIGVKFAIGGEVVSYRKPIHY
jgi:hypothetical protein